MCVVFKMRFLHATIRLLLLVSSFFALSATSVIAVSLTTIDWDDNKKNYFQFNIGVNTTVDYSIDNQVDKAGYFIVDLKDISPYGTQDIPVNHQLVPLVRPAYDFDNHVLRFAFYVQRPIEFSVTLTTNSPPTLIVRIFRQNDPTPTPFLQKRKKVVVIDPGHGGTSYGARSPRKVDGRYVWEKDIVLQIGKMLQRHIDNSPNMIARMTRTKDTTLSLSSRIQISEQVKGDVFISLHCNAVYGKRATNAHGIEFYFLNEKGSQDEITKQLEALENEDTINEELYPA